MKEKTYGTLLFIRDNALFADVLGPICVELVSDRVFLSSVSLGALPVSHSSCDCLKTFLMVVIRMALC